MQASYCGMPADSRQWMQQGEGRVGAEQASRPPQSRIAPTSAEQGTSKTWCPHARARAKNLPVHIAMYPAPHDIHRVHTELSNLPVGVPRKPSCYSLSAATADDTRK